MRERERRAKKWVQVSERGARKEGETALVRESRRERERERANEYARASVQNHRISALTL